MKKTKIPRKKIRGKNMKKLFACLLSLAMIPANGAAVFAQEQKDGAVTQTTEKAKSADSEVTEDSSVTFAKDSQQLQIGCIKDYKFEGIDAKDIKSVSFDGDDLYDYISIYSMEWFDGNNGSSYVVYTIVPKKTGKVSVTACITKKDGTEIKTAPTQIKIEENEDIVPIKDESLFRKLIQQLGSEYDTATYITKEQIKEIKKLNLTSTGVSDLSGIQYATECEEIDLSNNSNLSDISNLAALTKLKRINLANTNISNISAISNLEDLTYLNLTGTKVDPESRFALIKSGEATLEEGTESSEILNIKGVLKGEDEVTSSDSSVVSVERKSRTDGVGWFFKAHQGKAGQSADITIKNGELERTIHVTVISDQSKAMKFVKNEVTTNMGCFSKIDVKNSTKDTNLTITSDNEDVVKTIPTYEWYGDDEYKVYRYEPQAIGENVTVNGVFQAEDGTEYRDQMKVSVEEVPETVVPLTKFETLQRLNGYSYKQDRLTWSKLRTLNELYIAGCDLTNKDIEWISKAEKCESLLINGNDKITDISGLENMKNLKELYLSNTSISSIDTLKKLETQLTYLDINETKISDEDRFELMMKDSISVYAGAKTENTLKMASLLKDSDKIEIEDDSIASYEVVEDEDNFNYRFAYKLIINGKAGMTGKTTKLKITSESGVSRTADINITQKDENSPGFANETMQGYIGKFSEIALKNMDGVKIISAPVSDNEDIVKVRSEETYDPETEESITHYYLEPKSEGPAKLEMKCKINGVIYTDTMTVNIAMDDKIVPVKNYELFKAMVSGMDDDSYDQDYISKSDATKIQEISAYNLDIEDLSGIEYATECERLELPEASQLKDISQLKSLTKLKEIDLSGSSVKDISVLKNMKDQLEQLDLTSSEVSASDRFDMIRNDQTITVEAGTKKTVKIKPVGIIEDSDQCTIDEQSALEITNKNGTLTIDAEKAEIGDTANVTITNNDAGEKSVTIPIRVTRNKKKVPCFKNKSLNTMIGSFDEIKLSNASKMGVSFKSNKSNIVDVEYAYLGDARYRLVPKNEGEPTITATFKNSEGTVYTDTMTVKVSESKDIVPLKSLDTYEALCQKNKLNEDFRITQEEAKKVTDVIINSEGTRITKDQLSGIDQFKNCEKFDITCFSVDYEYIKPILSEFTKLKSLYLGGISISQEEFNDLFSNENIIKNLEELYLSVRDEGYNISDFSALGKLKNLKELDIPSAQINSLDAIKNLTKLETLNLQFTQLDSLDGIENLTQLKSLLLTRVDQITDFSAIGKLKNLEELDLEGTNIKDVTDIKKLEKLAQINLADTEVSAEDRLSLIRTKEIVLEEGEKVVTNRYTTKGFLAPNGIIDDSDEVILDKEDQGITCEQEVGSWVTLEAKQGSKGATANLIIKHKGVTYKTIPVRVIAADETTPDFAKNNDTVSIGCFKEISLKNLGNMTIQDMDDDNFIVSPADDDDWDVIETEYIDGTYHYSPKKAGDAKLELRFTTETGKTYRKQLKVTVTDAPENIIPITRYDIFESLLDTNGNSVDVNKDYMIDTTEMNNVKRIQADYKHVKDSDLEYLKKAVNCEKMDISDNKGITDLSFVNDMPYLKELNLENDEKIEDFSALINKKAQFDKVILPEQISDKDRMSLISTDEVSMNEGDVKTKAVRPYGIMKDTDKVSVGDDSIVEAKIKAESGEDVPEDEDLLLSYIELKAKKEGTTTLTIQMGSETKTIQINVKKQDEEKKVAFADASKQTKLGTFKTYKFANVNSEDIQSVTFNYGTKDQNVLSMIQNTDGTYTPVAKNKGTVSVGAKIKLKNGDVKEIEQTQFKVSDADSDTVVIKDYDLYKGMKNNGKSADVNGDGKISESEIKNVDEIIVKNSETLSDLTGVEKAENCKKVEFSNDAQLKDISALKELKNLTNVILLNTSVKESDQLTLLRLNDVSVKTGESKTQDIMPSGLLDKDAKVEVENSKIASAKIENGKLEVTGNAVGTTTVSIYNTDKKAAKVINITVTAKTTEKPKPEPTQPTTEAPKPTPTKPTTAAPQKVAKITVTAPSNKLSAGKKVKLTANISNNASNKNIKWTTSNKKYATVDKNGVVTFNKKAAGKTVTITAYATDGSGKKATFKIKIMKGTVKKIKITGKKTVKAGKTLSLKAKVTASKGANKKLKWTSSNTKYATVSASGKVKALKAGKKKSVKITAMATDGSGKKATVTIKIK